MSKRFKKMRAKGNLKDWDDFLGVNRVVPKTTIWKLQSPKAHGGTKKQYSSHAKGRTAHTSGSWQAFQLSLTALF